MSDGHSVEFFGESFGLNPPDDYQWAMLEFAEAAQAGVDGGTMEGLAAAMSMLKAAIREEQWARFRSLARKNKARFDEHLLPVIVAAFRQETPHPTERPSDSSDGPASTPPSSEAASSSALPEGAAKVIRKLESEGRPDMALMVLMAEEQRQRSSAV